MQTFRLMILLLIGPMILAQVQSGSGSPLARQYTLHGKPFVAHSTAFFYNRLPRDEWAGALIKLKRMGINTIDLYLAWNWHEPEEGKIDFDGRTNPRRDVKALLAMLDEMGMAVIARPGPVILNEWRNGGYPDWLLSRPEFKMHEVARLDGHYPPLSGVSPTNSEEGSRQWLANETHLRYTRKWFETVMRELLFDRQATRGGNLIAIQLDDDQAINRANYNGPIFWRYMNELARYLREAGATVPLYLNPTDMRVSAAGAPHDIGVMGQWYFNFGAEPALRWEDTAVLQFYVETLKTQPHFPPMIIEYQAGWYGTGEDSYAKVADPTNTLLSSRVMLGHGLRGLNYFPVQDTLYPAGYEVPWSNHYYTWESALTLDLKERPRASAVHRNGRMIAGYGEALGGAHKVADLGLVYPIGAFEQAAMTREDVLRISRAQMQIQQFCQLNQLSVEYLDPEFQPLEQLRRHRAIVLPVFDEASLVGVAAQGREEISAANEPAKQASASGRPAAKLRLSAEAQRKLVDYVKGGGILIGTPALPRGDLLDELRDPAYASRVIAVPDYWKSMPLEPGKTKRDELIRNLESSAVEFVSRLTRLGINRAVKVRVTREGETAPAPSSVGATIEPDLVATQLVSGEEGLVSVVNFDSPKPMRLRLNVRDPKLPNQRLELPEFTLRARDSLMLPLRVAIDRGPAEIVHATAELVRGEWANGRIHLRWYAPDGAEILLKLPQAPEGGVTLDGRPLAPANFRYDQSNGTLAIRLPAVAAGKGTAEPETDRREFERDLEITVNQDAPQIGFRSPRLVVGEKNTIEVEVAHRGAEAVNGQLILDIQRGLRTERLTQDVTLSPRGTRTATFVMPLTARAVPGDFALLRSTLRVGSDQFSSRAVEAEIVPRFEWRIYPRGTWPVRADTAQEILPPLIYPSDEKATEAKFTLRLSNPTPAPTTIKRSSLLVDSLPLRLGVDEQYDSIYTYNFPPNTASVLHPFTVQISDGKATESATAVMVALRKGEAVAFAYDIDRDGFEDLVLENDNLRLIISPRAGGRSFALLDKRTGANLFTSVGGLRDKFVLLDPEDPTRNPRRKRGLYGTFNRPYAFEILRGMGSEAVVKLTYRADEIYPAGAGIERIVTLPAGADFFTVDYRLDPRPATISAGQAFWVANSIGVGDPAGQGRRFVTAGGPFEFSAGKTQPLDTAPGWAMAAIAPKLNFALCWRPGEIQTAEVEMKDFSSILNLKFKPFNVSSPNSYRVAYYLGPMTAAQLAAEQGRMMTR